MSGRQVVGEIKGKEEALQTKGAVEVVGEDWVEGGWSVGRKVEVLGSEGREVGEAEGV